MKIISNQRLDHPSSYAKDHREVNDEHILHCTQAQTHTMYICIVHIMYITIYRNNYLTVLKHVEIYTSFLFHT